MLVALSHGENISKQKRIGIVRGISIRARACESRRIDKAAAISWVNEV